VRMEAALLGGSPAVLLPHPHARAQLAGSRRAAAAAAVRAISSTTARPAGSRTTSKRQLEKTIVLLHYISQHPTGRREEMASYDERTS
jgi:hypothetical protein